MPVQAYGGTLFLRDREPDRLVEIAGRLGDDPHGFCSGAAAELGYHGQRSIGSSMSASERGVTKEASMNDSGTPGCHPTLIAGIGSGQPQ